MLEQEHRSFSLAAWLSDYRNIDLLDRQKLACKSGWQLETLDTEKRTVQGFEGALGLCY